MTPRLASNIVLAALLLVVFAAVTLGREGTAWAQNEARTPNPGEGVICIWSIYSIAAEVGRRCRPGEDAEFQQALTDAVARIDNYVVENTEPAWTSDQVAAFRRQQGLEGAPQEQVCKGEPARLYEWLAPHGAENIRRYVDALRPGLPTWGTCF